MRGAFGFCCAPASMRLPWEMSYFLVNGFSGKFVQMDRSDLREWGKIRVRL